MGKSVMMDGVVAVGGVLMAALILTTPIASAHTLPTPYCTVTGGFSVCTDQQDYSPGSTVHIAGSGFGAAQSYTIRVRRPNSSVVTGDGSFGPWPTAYDTVVSTGTGTFQFDYVLDGILGTYFVQVLQGPWTGPLNVVLATTTFTDSAADLDNAKNAAAGGPESPVLFEDGNAGASTSHYVEGYSITYRLVMSDLPTSTSVTIVIEYDIVHSDAYAIDYLTHYQRLDPHAPFLHAGGNG